MRHVPILRAALGAAAQSPPRLIADLGAGDGSLMLELASQVSASWHGVRVVLLDRQRVATPSTLESFHQFGWQAEVVEADAFEWLANEAVVADAVVANLFVHHFGNDRIAELFGLLARRTSLFVACETRRDWPSRVLTPCLGLLGCNAVTRHDARLSVRAGFVGRELSALWPQNEGWQLMEKRQAVFTHLFVAQKTRWDSSRSRATSDNLPLPAQQDLIRVAPTRQRGQNKPFR